MPFSEFAERHFLLRSGKAAKRRREPQRSWRAVARRKRALYEMYGRKKKRASGPLKTTRYGVSARRPMKEPADTNHHEGHACNDSNRDVPKSGIRSRSLIIKRVSIDLSIRAFNDIRVETVDALWANYRHDAVTKCFWM
jgi:hypothetical protein